MLSSDWERCLNCPSPSRQYLQATIIFELVWCLIGAFAIGLTRARELLGAPRYGLMGWLNLLRDVPDSEYFFASGERSLTL